EEGATLNPKEEECILVVEKNHTVTEVSSSEKAVEEPLVLPPTSSPSISNVEEEFELSNSMFKDEVNHGEPISDPKDTMEEVEHTEQGNEE
ncbi:hypothetical protein KI387_020884, partial [Taxus chinensis]